MTPDSPIYRKAFETYLRKGIAPEISIKAALTEHPTAQYIWRTQGDGKVRPSHAANAGKIFSWDNPPVTGNPGDDYGCRCWAQPYTGPESLANPDLGLTVTVSGNDVVIHRPDGSIEVRHGGSRSWRNNNSGNIRAGQWATQHGAIGSAGGFAVFPDENTGQTASKILLQGSRYNSLTIDQAIARRSPSNENDTDRLQRDIQKMGGFSGKEVIGTLSDEEMNRLIDTIKRTEGWIEGTVTVTRAPK